MDRGAKARDMVAFIGARLRANDRTPPWPAQTPEAAREQRAVAAQHQILDAACMAAALSDDPQARILSESALRALAYIHADHPDYQPEWAPH